MRFTQSARTVFLPPLLYRPFQETYGCETFQFGRYNIPDLKTYNILLDPLYTLMFGIENWEGWRKSHLIFPFWNTSLKIERYIFECSKHNYLFSLYYLFLSGFQRMMFYHSILLWDVFRVIGLFCFWFCGNQPSELMDSNWIVMKKKEFINLFFLPCSPMPKF